VILAGGLRPDHVPQAIAEVRPFGLDVRTGVAATGGSIRQSCAPSSTLREWFRFGVEGGG
jgi:hypothetical protein